MDLDPYLHLYGITLQRNDHAAVITCAESDFLVHTATPIVKHADSHTAARIIDVAVKKLSEVAS